MKVATFATLVGVICVLGSTRCEDWKPIDPEEALFVYTRCIEDNIKGNEARLSDWKNWVLKPGDDKYARCVLQGLEVIDDDCIPQPEHISAQQKAYSSYTKVGDEKVDKLKQAISGVCKRCNCETYAKQYVNIHNEHASTSRDLYHGNPEFTKRIYADKGSEIRQKGQSYIDFCEKKYYPGNNPILCQIRQYKVVADSHFDDHITCIFRGFRYLYRSGRLNTLEIKRDLQQVGLYYTAVDYFVKKCFIDREKRTATDFYKCMVEDPETLPRFREAFDYREVRSQKYNYMLDPKNREYNKDKVQKEIQAIDGGLKC